MTHKLISENSQIRGRGQHNELQSFKPDRLYEIWVRFPLIGIGWAMMSWPLTCCKGLEIPGGKVSRVDSWWLWAKNVFLVQKRKLWVSFILGIVVCRLGKKSAPLYFVMGNPPLNSGFCFCSPISKGVLWKLESVKLWVFKISRDLGHVTYRNNFWGETVGVGRDLWRSASSIQLSKIWVDKAKTCWYWEYSVVGVGGWTRSLEILFN